MDIDTFRADKEAFFRTGSASPIPPDERKSFPGLQYYPYTEELNFLLTLDHDVVPGEVRMDTSTGDIRTMHRLGKIHFPVRGRAVTLTVYGDANGYFLPFKDTTNGRETYGAGRYVDIEEQDGKLRVDFNKAYNPYCAYNPYYSCPIPLKENWLDVRIEAGEKNFRK